MMADAMNSKEVTSNNSISGKSGSIFGNSIYCTINLVYQSVSQKTRCFLDLQFKTGNLDSISVNE